MFPVTLVFNQHAHPIPLWGGGDELHRGAKVGDIHTATQALRKGGSQKIHHQRFTLAADIHPHLVVGQSHNHTAGIVRTTAEVHILERIDTLILRLGKMRCSTGGGAGSGHSRGHCYGSHRV